MLFVSLSYFPVLGHILYSDFRQFKVNVWVLVLLTIISITKLFLSMDFSAIIPILTLNILLLGIIFLAIFLTARIKKKNFNEIIGGGDIWFLLVAGINFSPLLFNLFITISALIGIIFLLVRFVFQQKNNRLPYAGIMAIVLFGFVVLERFTSFSMYNDNLIYKILQQ